MAYGWREVLGGGVDVSGEVGVWVLVGKVIALGGERLVCLVWVYGVWGCVGVGVRGVLGVGVSDSGKVVGVGIGTW